MCLSETYAVCVTRSSSDWLQLPAVLPHRRRWSGWSSVEPHNRRDDAGHCALSLARQGSTGSAHQRDHDGFQRTAQQRRKCLALRHVCHY